MEHIIHAIKNHFRDSIDIYQRRESLYQVNLPIFYEDGDMVDIYLEKIQEDNRRVRILDCGMTLMRLSYTFDINTPVKEHIFNTILNQNNVLNQDGNLYLDSSDELIYQNIMQFVGCQQKIMNMRLWQREIVKSMFFEKLDEFIESDFKQFKPRKSVIPLSDYPVIEVDYALEFTKKPFYLFGVNNRDKARTSAIALLEFQKANLPFISMIIHEKFEDLPKKEQIYLTRNADKQFPCLEDFRAYGASAVNRLAA